MEGDSLRLKDPPRGSENDSPKAPANLDVPDTPNQKNLTDIHKEFDAMIEDMLACAQQGGGKQLKNMTGQEENQTEAETEDDDSDSNAPAESPTSSKGKDHEVPNNSVAVKPKGYQKEKASWQEL